MPIERQIDEFLNIDHHSDEEYTMDTNPADLFANGNYCVLTPEVTEGPYCTSHQSGSIRKESQRKRVKKNTNTRD